MHTFEQVPSTNAKLWEMIAQGAKAGTVAIAQSQSSGKGQRGRFWQSDPGGLYLSLALEPDWPVTHSAQLTCISAWGIATAFNNLGLPIQIKWPNDLYFQGKKLGGILTETKLAPATSVTSALGDRTKAPPRIKQAVIGVGINWHNAVPSTGITLAQILKQMPESTAKNKINCLEMLAALVLKGILQGYFFQQRVGSQDFMKVYSNLLTQVGSTVLLESNLRYPYVLRASDVSITEEEPSKSVQAEESAQLALSQSELSQLKNRSGEVIGVSEEGYLQVAISRARASPIRDRPPDSAVPDCVAQGCIKDILLIKPSEIHIS